MANIKKQELTIFLIILGLAAFFRFLSAGQQMEIVAPTIGILTVIGLYLLAKEMFEWRLAAIASFLLAISFWHVNISRSQILSGSVLIPLVLVWGFFFLWRGIKKSDYLYFALAGITGGLGFYIPAPYCWSVLIGVIIFINFWSYLKKDYLLSSYEHAKSRLLKGFVLTALIGIFIAIPIGFDYWQNPDQLLPITNSNFSVFNQSEPIKDLGQNIIKTLGMFNFEGDLNPTHNIPGAPFEASAKKGSPILPWPIGIFFVFGFINELIHWLRKKHGHWSTTHTLLFAWFFIMLLPGFFSANAPDTLKTVGVLPIVMIFTARGIWWFFNKLNSWYDLRDGHSVHEGHVATTLVMIIFLSAIGFMEYWRYFRVYTIPPVQAKVESKASVKKTTPQPTPTEEFDPFMD